MLGDVKLLEVAAYQLAHGLLIREAGRKKHLAQLVERDLAQPCHALRHGDVTLRAGGGFEHYRVGEYRRCDKPRHCGRRQNAVLLIHTGDDGRRAADGLVAHPDGLHGLNVGKTVMVDYLKYLRLLKPRHRLTRLVVVNKHDTLSPRLEEVIAGEGADDTFVLVKHRIAAEAAL